MMGAAHALQNLKSIFYCSNSIKGKIFNADTISTSDSVLPLTQSQIYYMVYNNTLLAERKKLVEVRGVMMIILLLSLQNEF